MFVGDNDIELSVEALKHDRDAKLLDWNLYKSETLSGTYYTSLADFDTHENFFNACINATEIVYCPPKTWSDLDKKNNSHAKARTEAALHYCKQYINVTNLNTENKKFLDYFTKKDRKTPEVQLWVAGCSVTEGVGVEHDQTWKEHVRKELNLKYTDLSQNSASITWSADQILRSDIQKDDIVLWQLTTYHRNFAIDEKTEDLHHLLPSKFESDNIKKSFPIEYIDSKTTVCKNILSIQQVYNFCKKIEAKLVILGTMYDWENNYLYHNVPCFEQIIVWPMRLVDLGSDNLHPGPEQHKIYAKKFIELLKKYYE